NVSKPNFNSTARQPPAILHQSSHAQGAKERQIGQVEDDQRIRVHGDAEQLCGDDLGLIETGLALDGHPQKTWPAFDMKCQFAFELPSRAGGLYGHWKSPK